MKTYKIITSIVLSIMLLAIIALPAFAQEPGPVTLEIDRTSLSTDEALLLVVTLDASSGNYQQPALPALDGFELVNSSSSSQFMMVNGDVSMNARYEYWLRPLQAGDLVIGPIHATVDGQVYTSDPITIQVTQGTGQVQPLPNNSLPNIPDFPAIPDFPGFPSLPGLLTPPSLQGGSPQVQLPPSRTVDPSELPAGLNGQDFFVGAEIDKLSAYVGEQVIYTFRFYRAVESFLDEPSYEAPAFSGFWHEQQPEELEYVIQAAGRNYRVIELQTVLFPTVSGELKIDPGTITIPGDFFVRGQTLTSQPISLQVNPLPAGAPASFQGAVGQFELRSEVDTTETVVNDTVTLKAILGGRGNITTLTDLAWNAPPQWRAYDSQTQMESRFEDGDMYGIHRYERVLIPIEAGQQTLPPIEFSYFDPDTESYQTINSQPITINVAPDPNDTGQMITTNSQTNNPAIISPEMTFRTIKPAPQAWRSENTQLTDLAAYWWLWALPVALIAGQFGWQYRQSRKNSEPAARRRQQAANKANQALHQASKNPADVYNQAAAILITYLEDKLGRPVSGQTHTSLTGILQQSGVPKGLAYRLEVLLVVCEMGRYAPSNDQIWEKELLDETKALIKALEKVL